MALNQNETRGVGMRNSDCGIRNSRSRDAMHRAASPIRNPKPEIRNAFTLTELLVVITIIAVLAGLATNAAINALNAGKRTVISLEIDQLATAIEQFKIDNGSYPPNVFSNGSSTLALNNAEKAANTQELIRALKESFPRSTEFQLNADHDTGSNNVFQSTEEFTFANVGLSPAEALVFWLQGFSSDPSRPLSGTDLTATQIDDEGDTFDNVLTIDSFKPRYDFDRGRLRFSRNPNGTRRYISIYRAGGGTEPVQLQLYEYVPSGSQEPFVYFDTSRKTPQQVAANWETTEFFYSSPTSGGNIYPLKRLRANAPDVGNMSSPTLQYVEYVNARKFQILHCGLDDAWGDFSNATGSGGELDVAVSNGNFIPQLLYPEGPFIGDIADTLSNFATGTLEAAQE